MSEPLCPQKRPYVVAEGPGPKAWCACGHSTKQPYCDGSHKGTGMAPVSVKIDNPGRVAWCGCKQTKTPPYCDGSHSKI